MDRLTEMLALVQENIAKVLSMANLTMTWIDVIEILIISFLFYHILLWIKSTRAWNLFKGIMVILIFVLLAALFQMSTILWIAENSHRERKVATRTAGGVLAFAAGQAQNSVAMRTFFINVCLFFSLHLPAKFNFGFNFSFYFSKWSILRLPLCDIFRQQTKSGPND